MNNVWLQTNVNFDANDQLLNETLENILNNYEVPDGYMLIYHGTNWNSVKKINNKIRIIERENCSDFGMRNFYTTDSFKTAKKWAFRKYQPAIVVFMVPIDFITNLDRHYKLELDNIEEWRNVVFTLRNPPSSNRELKIYNEFVENIDSNDLISGPICVNPYYARSVNNLKYLKQDKCGYQYCFKDSIIDILDSMKLTTIYFQKF